MKETTPILFICRSVFVAIHQRNDAVQRRQIHPFQSALLQPPITKRCSLYPVEACVGDMYEPGAMLWQTGGKGRE